MAHQMNWQIRVVPLTKNLSSLDRRSMVRCYSVSGRHCRLWSSVTKRRSAQYITSGRHHRDCRQHHECSQTSQHHLCSWGLTASRRECRTETRAKCNDPTVRYWMRMMSGTYQVNSYLHRIKKVKSPNCTFCDRGELALSQGVPSIPSCSNHSTQQGATSSVHAAPETRLSRLESCRRNSYVSNWSPSSRCAHSWSAADERFKTLKSKEVRWA